MPLINIGKAKSGMKQVSKDAAAPWGRVTSDVSSEAGKQVVSASTQAASSVADSGKRIIANVFERQDRRLVSSSPPVMEAGPTGLDPTDSEPLDPAEAAGVLSQIGALAEELLNEGGEVDVGAVVDLLTVTRQLTVRGDSRLLPPTTTTATVKTDGVGATGLVPIGRVGNVINPAALAQGQYGGEESFAEYAAKKLNTYSTMEKLRMLPPSAAVPGYGPPTVIRADTIPRRRSKYPTRIF
jgi:hypothetical protein